MFRTFFTLVIFLTAGCADQTPSQPTKSEATPLESPAAIKTSAVDTNGLSTAESQAIAQARRVLAAHLELPNADDAELVEISAQQWRNTSLGCPQPGEMSAQVITEGYSVVLKLAGEQHQVNTGGRGGRVCQGTQGRLQPRSAL